MDPNQINFWLSLNAENFAPETLPVIRGKLEQMDNSQMMFLQNTSFKKPSTILIIAIFLGWERFFLNDIALGIVKFITGYGCGIWWLIDLFTAKKRAQKYNFQQFQKLTGFAGGGNFNHFASASALPANAVANQPISFQAVQTVPSQVMTNPQNFYMPDSQPQNGEDFGGFMKNLLNRAKQLLVTPGTEYLSIELENAPHTKVLTHYVLPLMLIPVLFAFTGYGLVGYSVGGYHFNEVSLGLFWAAEQILLLVGGIYITALIFNSMSKRFGASGNFDLAFALVAYAYTPMFFAGIFHIWHELSWIVFSVGIYGLYLLITGLKPMMKPDDEKADSYSAISWIVAVVVFVVLMKVLEAIILPSSPSLPKMPSIPSIPSFQFPY